MTDLHSSTRPVARKAHRCDDCNRTIELGETYRYSKGLSEDGDFGVWKDCAHCLAFLESAPIVDWDYAEGYSPDDFAEFEPGNDDERLWHTQWKARWVGDDGALVPIPVRAVHEFVPHHPDWAWPRCKVCREFADHPVHALVPVPTDTDRSTK